MKHGFIAVGDYTIWSNYDISFCNIIDSDVKKDIDQFWNDLMRRRGLATEKNEDTIIALFDLICSEFASVYKNNIDIICREGYITTDEGNRPVNHNKTMRVFSKAEYVYIDLLMSSVLYDYAAASYLWARFPDEKNIRAECFKRTLYTFDGCCRKGIFPDEDGTLHLLRLIDRNLDNNGIVFVSDLYWCMIAFALCHEIAHIYLEHTADEDNNMAIIHEYQADEAGYDIYLRLMLKYMHNTDDEVSSVFREYFYAAPMILLLFYHGLFVSGYWMYGDTIAATHPHLLRRIDRLLEISQNDKYNFDTVEGNAVLQSFWEASDQFLEELFYKLKNGKLERIIRKGCSNMKGKGFEEAFMLDEVICKRIREYADQEGYESTKLIGLWNSAAYISTDSFGDQNGLVAKVAGDTYSIKATNIIYKQKAFLDMVIESGLSVGRPGNTFDTVRIALYLIYRIALSMTIKITEAQAKVLVYCYQEKAYSKAIDEEILLKAVPEASSETLTTLNKMGCIQIEDGKILLLERVIFS